MAPSQAFAGAAGQRCHRGWVPAAPALLPGGTGDSPLRHGISPGCPLGQGFFPLCVPIISPENPGYKKKKSF